MSGSSPNVLGVRNGQSHSPRRGSPGTASPSKAAYGKLTKSRVALVSRSAAPRLQRVSRTADGSIVDGTRARLTFQDENGLDGADHSGPRSGPTSDETGSAKANAGDRYLVQWVNLCIGKKEVLSLDDLANGRALKAIVAHTFSGAKQTIDDDVSSAVGNSEADQSRALLAALVGVMAFEIEAAGHAATGGFLNEPIPRITAKTRIDTELIRHLTVLAIVCALAAPSTRSRRFCAALSKISENGHRRLAVLINAYGNTHLVSLVPERGAFGKTPKKDRQALDTTAVTAPAPPQATMPSTPPPPSSEGAEESREVAPIPSAYTTPSKTAMSPGQHGTPSSAAALGAAHRRLVLELGVREEELEDARHEIKRLEDELAATTASHTTAANDESAAAMLRLTENYRLLADIKDKEVEKWKSKFEAASDIIVNLEHKLASLEGDSTTSINALTTQLEAMQSQMSVMLTPTKNGGACEVPLSAGTPPEALEAVLRQAVGVIEARETEFARVMASKDEIIADLHRSLVATDVMKEAQVRELVDARVRVEASHEGTRRNGARHVHRSRERLQASLHTVRQLQMAALEWIAVSRNRTGSRPSSSTGSAQATAAGAKPVSASKPAVVSISAVKPVAVKPVAVKPVAVKPIAVKPVAVKPLAVKPIAVKPIAVKPVGVRPVVKVVGVASSAGEPATASSSATTGAVVRVVPSVVKVTPKVTPMVTPKVTPMVTPIVAASEAPIVIVDESPIVIVDESPIVIVDESTGNRNGEEMIVVLEDGAPGPTEDDEQVVVEGDDGDIIIIG